MKIKVIGGGPGGLYFSILTKKRLPHAQIDVYEQNHADDAFGFGVVFSDETLSEFLSYDEESYELIRKSFAYWDDLDVVRNTTEKVRIKGNGFCGCSRKTLLLLLQQRCKEVGVNLHFETRIDDVEQFAKDDMVVVADGINSTTRKKYEYNFGTGITIKNNRFIWCGSTKPLDAFAYFFKQTPYGTFCAHTYQYETGKSTWIFECSNETYIKAGFEGADEQTSLLKLQELYKEELEGHSLIGNKSFWRQFPYVENKSWFYKNMVLLGDAKATAHYSIGSGTKLAMDCAIALSNAVVLNTGNVQQAFNDYEKNRRAPVEMIQYAATVSSEWFENMDRHIKLPFDAFSFSVMSRSKKITIENQARRDAAYAKRIINSFNKENNNSNLDTSPAFTPYQLGSLQLVNRIVMSPMGQYCAKDGVVQDWHSVHYGSHATGGVGLIIAEMTAVSPEGRITRGCAGIWNDEQATAWRKIVDFVHQQSAAKIGIQIGHSGRKGSSELVVGKGFQGMTNNGWDLFAPSPIPYDKNYPVPKEMNEGYMKLIHKAFVDAVVRAKQAGFDLVEVQAHHGFLLGSFLSPLTNKRTDQYGGSIENRASYPLQIIADVKNTLGANYPVSVRISASDWHKDGIAQEDVLYFAGQLKALGVDIINVSTGNTVPDQKPIFGRMWQSTFSEWIRNTIDIPTITAGGITDIDQINTLLLNQRADLVALGRTLLINPGFVREAMAYEQFSANDLSKTYLPMQYVNGAVALYSEAKKSRQEYENMKQAMKPKSHQYK